MTVKTRGIRLKRHISPEDQGQQKLMQVTNFQVAAARSQEVPSEAADSHPVPAQPRPSPATAKRRAVARMLRIELEATLAFLDQALDEFTGNEPLPGSGQSLK